MFQQINEYKNKMQKSIMKTLGIIDEEQEKEEQAYENVLHFIKNEKNQSMLKDMSQRKILDEIENFHRYYTHKCQEYKQNYQRISQQNWDYTTKIIKYEQALQNYQLALFEAKQQCMFNEDRIKELEKHIQKITLQHAETVNKKDREINEMRAQILKSMTKHEISKKKVVKLKQKSTHIEHEKTFNLESARSNRQLVLLKQQLESHNLEITELQKQNDILRKKIKHLQIDRKYQDDRLKQATLALQLDLKLKDEQIERLNNQIKTYESKFQELIENFKENHSIPPFKQPPLSTKHGSQNGERNSFLSSKRYENIKNIGPHFNLNESLQEKEAEKTHRKLNLETERTHKKITHKRTGSSNLQENRFDQDKEELNMKIKVYKFGKQKKYL